MIKQLREINKDLENEQIEKVGIEDVGEFTFIVSPILIKICMLIKRYITGPKGDMAMDKIILLLQGLQTGSLIITHKSNN